MSTEKAPTLAEVVERDLQAIDLPVALPNATEITTTTYRQQHAAKIAVLKEEVAKLPAVTDPASYEANDTMRKRLVKLRSGIDKARKAIVEPFTSLKKQVDGYLGTNPEAGLQGEIKALENTIEAGLTAWEEAEARKVQERNEARGKRLLAAGMAWDGARYAMATVVIWPADLQTMSDDAFEAFCTHTLAPLAAQEAARRDQERREAEQAEREEQARREAKDAAKREENEAMEREFERQRIERKKLDDDRAELDRQREELKWEKIRVRRSELAALGAELFSAPDGEAMKAGKRQVLVADLAADGPEEWEQTKALFRHEVVEAIQRKQDQEKQQARWKERAEVLFGLGAERDEAGAWTLGDATTTDHVLRTATAEEWAPLIGCFSAALIDTIPEPAPTLSSEQQETKAQLEVEEGPQLTTGDKEVALEVMGGDVAVASAIIDGACLMEMLDQVARFNRAVFDVSNGTMNPEARKLAKAIDEQCNTWVEQLDGLLKGKPL